MKKYLLLVILLSILFTASQVNATTTFITIASGNIGGTWYPLGGMIAEVLNRANVDIKATSRSAGSSRENCRLVATGKAQVGMSMGITLYQAYNGLDFFKNEGNLDLRILMNMYASPHHIVTTKKSGIKTLEDLRGKRVVLGAPSSGDEMLSTIILKTAGIDPDKDIVKELLTYTEAVMALKDGNVDAALWNFPTPAPAYLELLAVREMQLITIPIDIITKIIEKHPFLLSYTIKAGTYDKQEYDVTTIADGNYLIVHANMTEELSYILVKNILENQKTFLTVTAQAQHFIPEEASKGIIPFSKGSKKYFLTHNIVID